MQASWLEAIAGVSLSCFHLVMAGLVMLAVIRRRSAPRGAPPAGRLGRLVLEYVGNLDDPAERRRDPRGRALIDWVKREMEARDISKAKEEVLLEDLRYTLSRESWAAAEGRSAETVEEPPS